MKGNAQPVKEIGGYALGKTLGAGTFSKVKLATHQITNEPVAVKVLEKSKILDVSDTERVLREIHILKLVRHPNIVQLYDIVETPKKLLLVMEFMENGQLFQYIIKNRRIKEYEACKMFHQLIDALQYIHKLGIVHRDLKPENLLLDHRNNIKLVDFGLSNTYKDNNKLNTPCGSQCYAAPEMLRGQPYQCLKVDIWSAGVILFAMLCGQLPFQQTENFNEFYDKISTSNYQVHKSVSEPAKDLIKNILNVNIEQRYNINEIRSHPWMKQGYQYIPRGIVFGKNIIPIDNTILCSLDQYGISEQQINKTKASLQANRHNKLTTTYYLAFKKFIRQGGISNCDLNSAQFNTKIANQLKQGSQKKNSAYSMNRKSIKQSIKLKMLVDTSTTRERSHKKSKSKQKSKQNHKSKDKMSLNRSYEKKKMRGADKENIHPNLNYDLNQKPRKIKTNSISNIDPIIENSINYGRGAMAGNSSNILYSKELDRGYTKKNQKDNDRNSHFENRLSRKYKQKFNQSLVSRSKQRVPVGCKSTIINNSSHIMTTRPTKKYLQQNTERRETSMQKTNTKKRVMSHKGKSKQNIQSIRADQFRLQKARWI